MKYEEMGVDMDIKTLKKYKKNELVRLAQTNGIKIKQGLKKNEIIDLLLKSSKTPTENENLSVKPIPKRRKSKIQSPQMTAIEEDMHESFAIPVTYPSYEEKREEKLAWDLPYGYDTTKFVAIVRDPYWVYMYWDFSHSTIGNIAKEYEKKGGNLNPVIRTYDITDIEFDGTKSNKKWDTRIHLDARNWYLCVGEPNRTYIFDLGLVDKDGNFYLIVRSNIITTPLDGPSNIIDEKWMSADFDEIYAASGGYNIGLSSGAMKKRKEVFREWITSGMVSSPAKRVPKQKKDFFLNISTEFILYGKTMPDALLTVDGTIIPLRHDGSFTLRYFLPDGQKSFPVVAHSFDGDMSEQITVEIQKETK